MARWRATRPPKEWPRTTTGLSMSSRTSPTACAYAAAPHASGGGGDAPNPGRSSASAGNGCLVDRCDHGVEVPVGPGPAVEGEDTGPVGAGDGAEEAPAGKGPEHEGQRTPPHRVPHPARGKRSVEPIVPGRSTISTSTISRLGRRGIHCHLPFLSPLRGLHRPPRGRGRCAHPTELPGHPTEGTSPSSPGSNRSVR